MNNIPGVSYPIDEYVRCQLKQLPALADRISLPDTDRSSLEVVRLLGNTHYSHIRELLEFLNNAMPIAGSLGHEVCRETDPMQFNAKLAELCLLCHVGHRMPGRVRSAGENPAEKHPDLMVRANGLDVAIEVYGPMDRFGYRLIETYALRVLKYS